MKNSLNKVPVADAARVRNVIVQTKPETNVSTLTLTKKRKYTKSGKYSAKKTTKKRDITVTQFEVEKNIPRPLARKKGQSVYPFAKLAVGNSFFIPAVKKAPAYTALYNYKKTTEGKTRQFTDPTPATKNGVKGYRYWRIK